MHPLFRSALNLVCLGALSLGSASRLAAAEPRPAKDLRGYFPFTPVASKEEWGVRRAEIERRVLVSAGLWPMPDKTPLNARVHGRVERDDYTVDRVIFESLPGHYVTGSLYLPKKRAGKMPVILSPHGHWPQGRFMDRGVGTPAVKKELETGAEVLETAARSPLQARCVHLARMGCAVFLYDMLGYADSVQFPEHRHGIQAEGFLGVQADLRLQTYFGLQTWNSVRALDFLLSLEGADAARVGCTGASGGGTQTMMIAGFDQRITAAFPCVMVSTAMQGGCTCENGHYLRVNQGNVDIAALTAPRPLGMTAADDWTKELATKGLPDLQKLYALLGVPDRVGAHIATQFPHNYNLPSRTAMYAFFNRHFGLKQPEPAVERDFVFLTQEEATVWSGAHAKPEGSAVGIAHEKQVCAWMSAQDAKHVGGVLASGDPARVDALVGAAWRTIVGRPAPGPGEVVWEVVSKEDKGAFFKIAGVARQAKAGESVPVTFWYPKQWKGGVDIVLEEDPAAVEAGLQQRLAAGVAVAWPELYMAGAKEQTKVGENLKARRAGEEYCEFSGYTFGYNPTLVARRVHDVSALTAMVRGDKARPVSGVRLVAGRPYTAVALAAGAVLQKAVDEVEVARDGFRFEKLGSHWDPDFVPGAVKYGDVDGLAKLVGKLTYR
jgi:hypothetical protein